LGVPRQKKKWWQTLPAIIGGITAFLSAITGLLVTVDRLQVLWARERTLSPDAWLSSADYQKLFDQQVAKQFYPTKEYGRLKDGRREFRGEWHSGPAPCPWESRGELTASEFKKMDADHTGRGYVLSWKSEFESEFGKPVIQAIWTQQCE
jgi:hypothetical protein